MDGIWLFLVPVETEVDIQLAQTMCGVIGVGAGKFWGAKDFCPNFPKLSRKVFMRLLPTNFLPQRT